MDTRRCIGVAVALQRYVDVPPVAARQRDLAAAYARQTGAPIRILSVEAPVSLVASALSLDEKLRTYAQPLVDAGLDVETSVRRGRPASVVLEWLDDVGADLLVLGSHSKQSPVDVDMGSAARHLLREAPCAVVLVRPTVAEQERAKQMMIPHYPWAFVYV